MRLRAVGGGGMGGGVGLGGAWVLLLGTSGGRGLVEREGDGWRASGLTGIGEVARGGACGAAAADDDDVIGCPARCWPSDDASGGMMSGRCASGAWQIHVSRMTHVIKHFELNDCWTKSP